MNPYYPECYALVSGGKDSLATAQVLADSGKLRACVTFDTGISTPDWLPFIRRTCFERKWPLEVYRTPASYDELVQRFGFPGPGKHGMFMNWLKGRCVRQFKKVHPNAVLASGVRANESVRRLGNTKPVSVWEGVPIMAPLYDWTTDRTWTYFDANGFQRSPAYQFLTVSGDCLCGAFAVQGEEQALRLGYPTVAARFDALTDKIKSKFPSRCRWGWGWSHSKNKTADQRAICVECGDTQEEEL